MAHPIHEANENSPYGNLKKDEFYLKHEILNQESFMMNKQNLKIFTQSWQPADSNRRLKGLVAMIHGYTSESGWLCELNAVAIAKAGFFVCALDLQGHGFSSGPPDHITDIQPLVDDCIQYFDSARANHPQLPHFLYGESLGGAIAMLVCLFGHSRSFSQLLHSLHHLGGYPLLDLLRADPTGRIGRESWPRRARIGRPMLIMHGGADTICDPEGAKHLYESASSKDKTLKIFPGMWHLTIGEPNQDAEKAINIILAWIEVRAASN